MPGAGRGLDEESKADAGLLLAAGVPFPVFGLLLNLILEEAAMSFGSVSVIANSLRLRRAKL
ncbi:hypothetical protein BH10ACI4_BH10ACI4_06010 [soil metagenome]